MAQVKYLKAILDKAGWQEMEATDDLTINSFTGDGAGLTNLDMDNASSGILDKAFYDSTMAGFGVSFLSGVLSTKIQGFQGIGVDASGMFIDYDNTTIGINAGKLAVVGDYATDCFSTINFVSGDDIVATGSSDTLNFTAGAGIIFTTDAVTNTIEIDTTGGAGGSYIAGDGLVENPTGTFNLKYDSYNNWINTVSISGFDGTKLDITGTVGDVDNPLISILDNALNLTFNVDQFGSVFSGDFNSQGNVSFGVDATSTITFVGLMVSSILPDASNTRNLGDATHRWEDIFVDDLVGGSKTVTVDNLVDKSAAETITGAWSFGGNINIGDAVSDTLTITSVVDSNILPDASNTRSLGGSSNRWEDIFVDDIIDTNGAIVASTRLQAIPDSGTSRPAASAAVRGQFYTTEGGAGVADITEICLKSAGDTYSWVFSASG